VTWCKAALSLTRN